MDDTRNNQENDEIVIIFSLQNITELLLVNNRKKLPTLFSDINII